MRGEIFEIHRCLVTRSDYDVVPNVKDLSVLFFEELSPKSRRFPISPRTQLS